MPADNPKRPFFEELDFQSTSLGDLALRRRTVAALDDAEVYEVTLGGGFLMSSLFTAVEIALADLALAGREGPLDVVVGGLGLGYTAQAALKYPAVRSLAVVEVLAPVIEWHRRGLVPLGTSLTSDPRCRFLHEDFFARAADPVTGFDPATPGAKWHAVLLDIDHSPRNLLAESNAALYRPEGLRRLAAQLHPGGIFAMWSDGPPDEEFLQSLREVFPAARAEIVRFPNPLLERESSSTVYLAEGASPLHWVGSRGSRDRSRHSGERAARPYLSTRSRLTPPPSHVGFPMIQTLEAEVDEQGTVRLARPVHFDRKHRVLVMVMPDEELAANEDEDPAKGWNQPYIDQPYRYLPSAS